MLYASLLAPTHPQAHVIILSSKWILSYFPIIITKTLTMTVSLFCCFSYSLWYRTACPQPSQPSLLAPSTCTTGPITLVSAAIPPNQSPLSIALSSPGDLLPYTSYEFQVGVTNSVGSINSTFSEPDTVTVSSSKEKLTLSCRFIL